MFERKHLAADFRTFVQSASLIELLVLVDELAVETSMRALPGCAELRAAGEILDRYRRNRAAENSTP